jgi:hypothetical protein
MHPQVGTQSLNLKLIMMEILVVNPKHQKCYEKIPQIYTILCKELQASICKSKLISKVAKVFYSSWAIIFRACIWKCIHVTFSLIFSFSLSKYSTFFVDLTNISLIKAYTSCTLNSFVVGTPYEQQEVRIRLSTLHAPSTTSPTFTAFSFRFQ